MHGNTGSWRRTFQIAGDIWLNLPVQLEEKNYGVGSVVPLADDQIDVVSEKKILEPQSRTHEYPSSLTNGEHAPKDHAFHLFTLNTCLFTLNTCEFPE